ncbi:MAG: YggS family pyridoxal phosphate-dependent enzyme [Saprospiraceae bacterium]
MLQQILKELATTHTHLIAVSKTKPIEQIMEMYHQGQRAFGENKVQELVEKQAALPADIEWHLIGHLQTNKVKQIAPFVHLIHSVDSLKLLQEIDKQAAKNNRIIDCLLQIKIAKEVTKFGLSQKDAVGLLQSEDFQQLQHTRIVGLMGMATFTDKENQVQQEFRSLKTFFDKLKVSFFANTDYFREISMGMSDDYPLAQKEGSTMVRIGSLLFGHR